MDDTKVDQQTSAVAEMAQVWPIIDSLVGGTLAMRKAGEKLLPKWPKEDGDSYKERLATAVLFGAFNRTTEVLAAKPFARPIQIEGVSSAIEDFYPNIDMEGTDLHAFCGHAMLACLRYGLHGVLVDVPKAEGVRSKADEKAAGIRPYFTHYPASSILGWRSNKSADDGNFLTQLRLKEQIIEEDGPFGEKKVDQVRVLYPGKWEVWRQTKILDGRTIWEVYDSGTTSIDVIPFVFFYGLRDGFGIGKPPLIELAYMNVEHWQSSSDQQTILHVARVPVLFAKGMSDEDEIVIGSKAATSTKNVDADLKYVEHSGEAIESGRQSIHDLEDRMRQTGAELLTERQGEVTAQQVNSEDEDNRSTLQKITEEFEDSLEYCLKLMALWLGDKSADPEVELHKDFGPSEMDPDVLMGAADRKIVSKQTVREHLKRADVLEHDLDEDEELKRLGLEQTSELDLEAKKQKIASDSSDKLAGP